MLSNKLIQLIEDQWEVIAARVIHQIRHDPELLTIRKLPESELSDWGRGILKNFGHWLSQAGYQEIAEHYEKVGHAYFRDAIPLHEAVHAIHLLKARMIDFVRSHGFEKTSVEIYAEEELEHRVGRFFDWLVYHLVVGYEDAWRTASHRAA